jgi:transcriptional regulator with XRE-family HTH domain
MTVQPTIQINDPTKLGRSLRAWRSVRRVKQRHAAELLCVSQATVSRWETGTEPPDEESQAILRTLMRSRLDSAADHELARFVTQSNQLVHLICDFTHILLAMSASRQREGRFERNEVIGMSLWPFASNEIIAAEEQLTALRWFDEGAPAVEFETGPNQSPDWRIVRGAVRWVRFQLSGGTFVRLVQTLS